MAKPMSQSEEVSVRCRLELERIVKNRDVISKLSEILFNAVYDPERQECRYFSVLDRLATSISRYGAKAALFDLKRGSLAGGRAPTSLDEETKRALDTIELCLDTDMGELYALEVLKTIALNALSRCFMKG